MQLVCTSEVVATVRLSRTTIWRMVREGRFPAPIQITACRRAWRLSDISAWIADREANPIASRAYFGRTGEND